MNYQKLINSNIKELRLINHLTQEEFAEKIGISIQGLSNIERNRYQPTAKTINSICKAFDITPAELLLIKNNSNEDMIKNITTMLSQCNQQKLKKIYDMVVIMMK